MSMFERRIKEYILPCICSFLFILFFSDSGSPLYRYNYNYSSSFYSMIGRAITEGKIPYIDYFDLKGPIFFYWEALGQAILKGRGGVFLLELILILVSTVFIVRLCVFLECGKWSRVAVFGSFFIAYSIGLFGGNTSEELALPFNLACMYYGIRYVSGKSEKVWSALLFGVSFGVLAFSKITAAAPMCAVLLSVLIYMVLRKKFNELLLSALLFIIGFGIPVLPVVLYYSGKGALYQMLRWTFLLSFSRGMDDNYSALNAGMTPGKWELFMLPCFLGILIAYLLFKDREKKGVHDNDHMISLFLSQSIAVYVVMHLGSRLENYLATMLPLILLESVYIFRSLTALYYKVEDNEAIFRYIFRRTVFVLLCFVFLIGLYMPILADQVVDLSAKMRDSSDYYECLDMMDILNKVPAMERDDIACEGYGARFFEVNYILPANRYPYNGPYFGSLSEDIRAEVEGGIKNGTHKWIFTEYPEGANGFFVQMINEHYECVAQSGTLQLFKFRG